MPLPPTLDQQVAALTRLATSLRQTADAMHQTWHTGLGNEAMALRDVIRDQADRIHDIADVLPVYAPLTLPAGDEAKLHAIVEQAQTVVVAAEALSRKYAAGLDNDGMTARAALLTLAERIETLANALPAFVP